MKTTKPKLLVIGQLPPPVHGSTVMADRFMQALRRNGFDARMLQKTFSRRMDDVGRVTISKIVRIPSHCAQLVRVIREFTPELCVFFISVGMTALAVDALLLRILRHHKIPYVLYFHGKGYSRNHTNGNTMQRMIAADALGSAHGGMVLGERLKSDVEGFMHRERLHVVPNGVPDIERPAGKSTRDSENVQVLFLSNLVKTKGPMEFLKMAALVRKETARVRFKMVGRAVDARFHEEVFSFRREQMLEDVVEILGPLYGKEKEEVLNDTDILVFPTYKDTFPLVNLEAMQHSIPVVSSNEGAIPDIVRDGINGFIVDPKNIPKLAAKTLALVQDPALRRRMGQAGRELYEKHYTIEAYERNVREAMHRFLSGKVK
ncbi:MAG: glycosyltransferase family 1 protein [Desulfobacteraceae bacterium]|nr:MAG: glycosyltransferase family 1 protein [Desulfobacteraceae bacterium]